MGNPAASIVPNEYDTQLMFYDQLNVNNVGNTTVSYPLRTNAPYDVDPVFGSTSTPGFTAMANLFQFYRVVGYKYKFHVANKDTFPVCVFLLHTNISPGTGSQFSKIGNMWCQECKTIGSVSGSPSVVEFNGQHRIADIVGSKSPETDDNFASITSTNPSDTTYVTLGVDTTIAGNTFVNGVLWQVELWMLIRFYERKMQTS